MSGLEALNNRRVQQDAHDAETAALQARITTLERELEEERAANKALMGERTNLIETKRQQLTASQAEVERLKEALTKAADRAQQAVNTMQFNAKHMIAEDSLQDAWKMLELAKQQFSTDAVSVQEAVDIARVAIQLEESKP